MTDQEKIQDQRDRLETYRKTLAINLQKQAISGSATVSPETMHGIAEARSGIHKCKNTLRSWGVEVADHPDDEQDPQAGAHPFTERPKHHTSRKNTAWERRSQMIEVDVAALRQRLIEYFSDSELHDISFDLGIDYESLPGQGKRERARELVAYTMRRARIAELLEECHRLRPHVDWDDFNRLIPSVQAQHRPHLAVSQSQIALWAALAFAFVLLILLAIFRISSLPPTPVTPTTVASSPTPLIPSRPLANRVKYTSTDAWFSFELPEGWKPEELTKSTGGPAFNVEQNFSPPDNLNIYWKISITLIDASQLNISDITAQKLEQLAQGYISNGYHNLDNLQINDTFPAPDLQAAQVSWTCTFPTPDGANAPIRGLSEMRKHGDMLSLTTVYLPRDQFEAQKDAVSAIISSLEVLRAPTPAQ
ncbi:MAG: hypothetical protein HGA45_13285 [Chloroflexales bacterium]|nr:hypothetical protein [Chloroflexales bacterium]